MRRPRTFILLSFLTASRALTSKPPLHPISRLINDAKHGYRQRVSADPSFPVKSVAEVFLAAGTQLLAEVERRGCHRLLPELDFVLAGVLTAIVGKYYSMWRVAPTLTTTTTPSPTTLTEPTLGRMKVPTNAFQRFMLDGVTRPKLRQRLGSFVVPIIPLFRAGVIASALGYGCVRLMILIRSILVPSLVVQTQNVNILHAALYTGVFMAVVSNVRYQILQGVVEPWIQWMLQTKLPALRMALIVVIRFANGLLGSILAISGMRLLRLQQLK